MLDGCPLVLGPAREAWILQAVLDGKAEYSFTPIIGACIGHKGTFQVFADALKIDGIRIILSAETQQKIADALDCLLLTPKLADLIFLQSDAILDPMPRAIGDGSHMSDTQWMIDQSQDIDKALAKFSSKPALPSTLGKHWCIDESLAKLPVGTACNYGWHFRGPNFQGITGEITASQAKWTNGSFIRLIQGRGTRHDMHHSDYSQNCILVARKCEIDGVEMQLDDVLKDPVLSTIVSHQGPMTVLRQPGVPVQAPPGDDNPY